MDCSKGQTARCVGCCLLLLAAAACAILVWKNDESTRLLISTAASSSLRAVGLEPERWNTSLGASLGKVFSATGDDKLVGAEGPRLKRRAYLQHMLFNLGSSSKGYLIRKELVRTWWIPNVTRGYVWLDSPIIEGYNWRSEGLPEAKIAEDTSALPYYHVGPRAVLRLTRIVAEAYRLDRPEVWWFVMGDDDTVFNVEALAELLSKYDHTQMLLFGAGSEMVRQMNDNSFEMPFGGAGFIVSRPLARALSLTIDDCIRRYAFLYGSDARIGGCAADLGVQMTRLKGLHQFDVLGNVRGLLQAYSVGPLLSLHHVFGVDPVFPNLTHIGALQRLTRGMLADPLYFLTTAVCIDASRLFTIVVSWGYSVRILDGAWNGWDLEKVERTFRPFGWGTQFAFNVRDEIPAANKSCALPFDLWIDDVRSGKNEPVESLYSRNELGDQNETCASNVTRILRVKVIREASPASSLSKGLGLHDRWQCCRSTKVDDSGLALTIVLSNCKEGL